MREDKAKAKDSLRYQKKKKNEGDTTAADVAAARRRAAAARDHGIGVAAIRRRNGETIVLSPEEQERQQQLRATYSRRKVISNEDRYNERTNEDEIAEDADLGIDRQTTDLVAMLKEADDASGASFFKFKDEQLFESKNTSQDSMQAHILQVNFDSFEELVQKIHTSKILGLSEHDSNLVECALENVPAQIEKPIVPSFATNARGLVMFNAPMMVETNKADGIFVRNNPVIPSIARKETAIKETTEDELDDLLALDPKKQDAKDTIVHNTPLPKPLTGRGLLKPSSSHVRSSQETKEGTADDQAWLDQMLG